MIFNLTNTHLIKFWISLIIIAFGTSPAFALNSSNMNLLLIVVMVISPVILLISMKSVSKIDLLLILYMLLIIFSPLINHPGTMRWSTVIYSCMFIVTFITYKQLLFKNTFDLNDFEKIIRYLIYAYAIVLIIQQLCVLFGLPIFNISNYSPSEPWKLNSLTSEPSHSARLTGLLMFSYIIIKETLLNRKYDIKNDFKIDKWIWFSFLWTMVTMGSGTAFLFIFVVFSIFLSFRNLILLFFILIILITIITFFEVSGFDRTLKVFLATLTLDTNKIIAADPSASVRIVPFVIISQLVDFTTFNDWFGYGVDYVKSIFSTYVTIGGLPEGWTGGGMFQIWIDYGLLAFILFVYFSFSATYIKNNKTSVSFWFLLVFMYGVNSQIVWVTIVLLFTLKYFIQQHKREHYEK